MSHRMRKKDDLEEIHDLLSTSKHFRKNSKREKVISCSHKEDYTTLSEMGTPHESSERLEQNFTLPQEGRGVVFL